MGKGYLRLLSRSAPAAQSISAATAGAKERSPVLGTSTRPGFAVGFSVGAVVGAVVGSVVGAAVGSEVGFSVGSAVGF